ncbi:putative secondary metabolism biosynthetic enzyme [Trichoderma virens FT-333]|nr:putative secondary metabolism biosynthetic enzyme [Trichoderma virens FT-333]
MIHEQALLNPDNLALCAWDGDVTYKELDELSTRLAFRLVDEGVVANQIVPVCFEKSMWATVFMLEIQDQLHKVLPVYMVPSVYFKVAELSMTPSGKINRKGLREIGASFTVQELAKIRTAEKAQKRKPATRDEIAMQEIWSDLLEIDLETIGLGDDFFQLGVDSIAAMKLIAMARQEDIEITVADVFRRPTLGELVGGLEGKSTAIEDEILPFDLLNVDTNKEDVVKEIASMYGLEASNILDVYPSTTLQEGLLSLSSKQPGDYVWQMTLALSQNISVETFRSLQVVLDENIEWIEASGLEEYRKLDRSQVMEPGQRLIRFALIKDGSGAIKWFTWTIHHVLYDGWSMDLILKAYWEDALEDYDETPFPLLTPGVLQPFADMSEEISIDLSHGHGSGATIATLVRTAWALTAGKWAQTEDVVFGAAVSGRNAPVTVIKKMMAPTIATVPVRIKYSNNWKVSELIDMVHQQITDMIPFEQTGLRRIGKYFQPKEQSTESDYFGKWQENAYSWSGTYGLEILANLDTDSTKVEASFDSNLIQPQVVKELLSHFSAILQRLAAGDQSRTISEINGLAERDVESATKAMQRPTESHTVKTPAATTVSSVGNGVNQLAWVVDPINYNRPLAPGSVGEFLLDGSSLNTLNRTGRSYTTGGHGNLYSTGYLVRHNEDGSMLFLAQKPVQAAPVAQVAQVAQFAQSAAAQVSQTSTAARVPRVASLKIHGQPIDLSEVEHHVQQFVSGAKQVVAEVLAPVDKGSRTALAVFILLDTPDIQKTSGTVEKPVAVVTAIGGDDEDRLIKALPRHMIPTIFFSVEELPLTPSGKIDHKRLRVIG